MTSYAPFAYEPTARRAANGDRNPLLRKGSETTAHVAGFGLAIGGLRPSNTSMGFRQSETPQDVLRGSSLYIYVGLLLLPENLLGQP